MEVPQQLLCLFSAEIEERDESYVIEVPEQELSLGDVQERSTYRIALLTGSETKPQEAAAETEPEQEGGVPEPPVEEGELRDVEIEAIGEQGDGIARVERGFVVIVPDTENGERATVEITEVRQTVAFAEVVERQSHFH